MHVHVCAWVKLAEATVLDSGLTHLVRPESEHFSNFIPNEKGEQIELYQTIKDLPPDILTNTRADIFWGKIGRIESTTGKPFGLLSDIAT